MSASVNITASINSSTIDPVGNQLPGSEIHDPFAPVSVSAEVLSGAAMPLPTEPQQDSNIIEIESSSLAQNVTNPPQITTYDEQPPIASAPPIQSTETSALPDVQTMLNHLHQVGNLAGDLNLDSTSDSLNPQLSPLANLQPTALQHQQSITAANQFSGKFPPLRQPSPASTQSIRQSDSSSQLGEITRLIISIILYFQAIFGVIISINFWQSDFPNLSQQLSQLVTSSQSMNQAVGKIVLLITTNIAGVAVATNNIWQRQRPNLFANRFAIILLILNFFWLTLTF